jgi:predicted DNA-binding protein (MmcQ/YjbR family)
LASHLQRRRGCDPLGWNSITLDSSLPDHMLADLLGDSYDRSRPRSGVIERRA